MPGTLRVHFTREDLALLRVAPAPDPMWELVLSAYTLRDTGQAPDLMSWRTRARRTLARQPLPSGADMLRELTRPGSFPDFLTPVEAQRGFEDGLEALRSTPRRRLRGELELIGAERSLPTWADDLADGDPELLDRLDRVLRGYYEALLAPHWPVVRAHIDADRSCRARAFLDGGCDQVLASLRPTARWLSPVLEATYFTDREMHLRGRGLLLIPSYFCWGAPVTLIDDTDTTPVLIYPVEHDLALTARTGGLGTLLGHTRAILLDVLADTDLTTGELARRLHVTAGNISQHTKVLREAQLISTRRHANAVLHTLTPLGRSLLDGNGSQLVSR